jgi:hypothetical protein
MKKQVVSGMLSIVSCILSLVLVLLFLYGCATLSGPTYKEFSAKLPSLEPNNGRLVFYGYNKEWLGLAFGGYWKPTIAINGENISMPYGQNIFFIVDRPHGENKISVDGEHSHTLIIERGNTYFYEMQKLESRLKLLKVDPGYSDQMIKSMTYKAGTQTKKED